MNLRIRKTDTACSVLYVDPQLMWVTHSYVHIYEYMRASMGGSHRTRQGTIEGKGVEEGQGK